MPNNIEQVEEVEEEVVVFATINPNSFRRFCKALEQRAGYSVTLDGVNHPIAISGTGTVVAYVEKGRYRVHEGLFRTVMNPSAISKKIKLTPKELRHRKRLGEANA
jgi:hypothetical protein